MVIADVGQSAEEEIDFAHPGQNIGANYGWPCYEGLILDSAAPTSECAPLPSPVVFPVLTYPHPQNCNGAPFCGDGIIGGYVMHDPTLPSIDGCYVYGDLGTSELRMVALGQPSAAASVALGPQIDSLSTFGLDASGHLYAADIGSGDVYRIGSDGNPATDPRCAPPPPPPPSPPVVTVQPTALNPPGGVTHPAPRLTALRITRAGTVTFRLNQPATVTFTVQRAHPGRETAAAAGASAALTPRPGGASSGVPSRGTSASRANAGATASRSPGASAAARSGPATTASWPAPATAASRCACASRSCPGSVSESCRPWRPARRRVS